MSDINTVLTNEQIDEICATTNAVPIAMMPVHRQIARAIERAVLAAATPNSQEFKEAERMRLDSEDLEALHMCLDKAEVPRHDSNHKQFSAWGRVLKYAQLSAQSAVQPVAYLYESESRGVDLVRKPFCAEALAMCPPDMKVTPLYTHPAYADAVDAKENK